MQEWIDYLNQARFLGPGQDRVLADEAIFGAGDVQDVNGCVDFSGYDIDGDVAQTFQIQADERAAVLSVRNRLDGAFHQLVLFRFQQRAGMVRRTGTTARIP